MARPVDEACHEWLGLIGCSGEIVIVGPFAARGYLDDPTKIADPFVGDPPWLVRRQGDAIPRRKGRPYKGGDLGPYNADGSIQFLGWKDRQ